MVWKIYFAVFPAGHRTVDPFLPNNFPGPPGFKGIKSWDELMKSPADSGLFANRAAFMEGYC